MNALQTLPAAARPAERAPRTPLDRWVERRIAVIWTLLLFNTLPWIDVSTVVPIPKRVAQIATLAALVAALLLAASLNRRALVRSNLVLGLFTVLAVLALATGVRGQAGLGAVFRPLRLGAFLLVLWLLTPWWGRRDMLLARIHLRALLAVCGVVLAGVLINPQMALHATQNRLSGVLWPIWPTAVGHFASVVAGMAVVFWLAGLMRGNRALLLAVGGVSMVLLSQTRTALVAMVAGVLAAAVALLLVRRRVRKVVTVALVAGPMVIVAVAPALSSWFVRGQSRAEIASLTGRKQVWDILLTAPRSELHQWLGYGLSDKSFQGRPIDNSWLAVYQDQGLVGVAVVSGIVLFLLVAPAFCRAGPAPAVALFLIVYSALSSYTGVGLGDASPYILNLVVAASLVAPPAEAPGPTVRGRSP